MPIRNLTAGKTRSLPVAQADLDRMYAILQGIDPTLSLDIVSGAQPASGPHRTGSHRHDVDASGFGHTADIVFSRDGRALMPDANKELYANYIKAAAPSFPGIGHYGWGIHVGNGNPAFWGPNKSAATADPTFAAAYAAGRGGAPAGPAGPTQAQAFQPALGDVVAPTGVATTTVNPMMSAGLGFIQRAEERRDREAEEDRKRREALFATPYLAGLYG
jgi:hypothetical protein